MADPPLSDRLHIVLLETSGNQSYIFATNKLRENLGASELTRNAGESWVMAAIAALVDPQSPLAPSQAPQNLSLANNAEPLRKKILSQLEHNHSIFDNSEIRVEIVVAASGKAILLTRDESTAKTIVQRLTIRALKEAPGLDLCGTILPFEITALDAEHPCFAQAFNHLLQQIHARHALIHAQRPGNATRFLRLPIVAPCKTSGQPAAQLQAEPGIGEPSPRSAVSLAKSNARAGAAQRLEHLLSHNDFAPYTWEFPSDPSVLEAVMGQQDNDNTWLAVVHADGNGLGQIFLDFAQYLAAEQQTWIGAFEALRQFSIALDRCTEAAFRTALLDTFGVSHQNKKNLPVVPLILGGDDLTVLCEGKKALHFTASYLNAFETETANSEIVSQIAARALGVGHLSACAGVAIVKPHFPFSVAYELAEALIKSAKTVKQKIQHCRDGKTIAYPSSALDFHILFDSSNVDLGSIRDRLTLTDHTSKTHLTGKPYVISPANLDDLPNTLNLTDTAWLQQHRWQDFCEKVHQARQLSQSNLSQGEESRSALPRSQAYGLRESLFTGRGPTDARLRMILNRYSRDALGKLLEQSEPPSLFCVRVSGSTTDAAQVALNPDPQKQSEPQKPTQNSEFRVPSSEFMTHYLDALETVEFLA